MTRAIPAIPLPVARPPSGDGAAAGALLPCTSGNPYLLPDGNVQIAFSGGRTSAYMLHHILDANGGLPDRCRVVFTNTGREMPETLDFVQECGSRWGVPIAWVERRVDAKEGFEVVSHNSASRNGEPFEAVVLKRRYLPNVMARFCTVELKIRAAEKYLRSLGWERWTCATGIRADEARRIKDKADRGNRDRWQNWYPLYAAGVSKADVLAFWARQNFDLRLPDFRGNTAFGNCDGCFLKSERFLSALSVSHPARHAWWEEMEAKVGGLSLSPDGAKFSKRFSRRELREFMERQGDLALSTEGMLCQATDGECFG